LQVFKQNLCTHLSPMPATCSIHLIILYFIALLIFCEEYKLCSFVQPPVFPPSYAKIFSLAPWS
jgi:hypothetical protein